MLSQGVSNFGYSQRVEKRMEFNYYYKYLKNGKVCKLFPRKEMVGYLLYDTINRVKEKVEFGEYYGLDEKDSSHFSCRIHNSENNFTTKYYSYANDSLIDTIEQWQFIGQKKSYLISKIIYEYDSDWNLLTQTVLNRDNSIWFKINYVMAGDYSKSPISLSYINDQREKQILENNYGHLVIVDSLNRPIEFLDYYETGFHILSATYYSLSTTYYSEYSDHFETELTYFENMRNLARIEVTYFNENNQIIKKTKLSTYDDSEYVELYFYDKKKLLKKKSYLINGEITSITKFKYQFYKD